MSVSLQRRLFACAVVAPSSSRRRGLIFRACACRRQLRFKTAAFMAARASHVSVRKQLLSALRVLRVLRGASVFCAAFAAASASAKPIAFADGWTVMGEYGAGTMTEIQGFYAPTFRYSIGGGHLSLNSDVNDETRDITYLRLNYLPKRWNFENAQANVFVWASAGRAHIGETGDNQFAWNVGGQVDYETRRIYASLRSDLHEASAYSHRIDTLQLGFAPYEHDYETLAVWLVLQARRYTGDLYDGTEVAALLRLFKRNAWLEAGATQDGNLQAMLMFNF